MAIGNIRDLPCENIDFHIDEMTFVALPLESNDGYGPFIRTTVGKIMDKMGAGSGLKSISQSDHGHLTDILWFLKGLSFVADSPLSNDHYDSLSRVLEALTKK